MQKRVSKTGVFMTGFVVGVVVSGLVVIGLATYVIRHPQEVIVRVVDMGMDRVIERTVQTIPQDYIGQRQAEIAASAEKFAQAFSQNRISSEETKALASTFFQTIADQQITPAEIDRLLQLINRVAE
ncbi:hypothetical protein JW824_02495 [bacterium]|nr:hypothetical protein [bacterium]RQV93276.1 MAG: hypothetical protein EH221_09890 [bacterium]